MPSLAFLNDSEEIWKARHTWRQKRLDTWSKRLTKRYDAWQATKKKLHEADPQRIAAFRAYQAADDMVDKWEGMRDQASDKLARRRKQIRAKRAKVSDHFDVSEFDCHNGAKVPAKAVAGVKELCREVIEPMRAKFGQCHVLSGYRPTAYNRSIGGATRSYHIYDLHPGQVASDLTFPKGNPAQWAAYARSLGKGGVGQYDRSGFVHVDRGPVRHWSG